MTCCSTESSYLERRYSAFTLGLSNLPQTLQRKLSTKSRTSSSYNWDYYYPDMQVIQPTPKPINEQLQPNTTIQTTSTGITVTTSKTAKLPRASSVKRNTAKDFQLPSSVIRKESIAYYDPEKAQAGCGQQIHSISADVVDVYPYNQIQSTAAGVGIHHGFQYSEIGLEQQQHRKIALIELKGFSDACAGTAGTQTEISKTPAVTNAGYENNPNYHYTSTGAVAVTSSSGAPNSSSISIDSTPLSVEKLNDSVSLGTISAKGLFNLGKRAPLASLSSFKISSIEYPDSEFQSPVEESVFQNNAADTDEDMQELSSDSEEFSFGVNSNNCGVRKINNIVFENNLLPTSEAVKKPIVKRYSLGASLNHRSKSALSSDCISLVEQQQSKEDTCDGRSVQTLTPTSQAEEQRLSTSHSGEMIYKSSSTSDSRRAQLLHQYSDTQSLPTTTEDDTCLTLNTELFVGVDGTSSRVYSELSKQNNLGCINLSLQPKGSIFNINAAKILTKMDSTGENCSASVSDSVLGSRQSVICLPSTLKGLIISGSASSRPTTTSIDTVSRSATDLSFFDESKDNVHCNKSTVMLDLPLIKLPIGEKSDSSNTSDEHEHSTSKEDKLRDSRLPSSSRKWSKETLF